MQGWIDSRLLKYSDTSRRMPGGNKGFGRRSWLLVDNDRKAVTEVYLMGQEHDKSLKFCPGRVHTNEPRMTSIPSCAITTEMVP